MKNLLLFLPGLFLCASLGARPLATQQSDLAFIRSKLKFYYAGHAESRQIQCLGNGVESIVGDGTASFWKNPSLQPVHQLIKALVEPPGEGGDLKLQYLAANILRVKDLPVAVIFFNDARPVGAESWFPCVQKGRVHPCNKTCRECSRDEKCFGGVVRLGLHFLREQGYKISEATFLHELTHTQDWSEELESLFVVHQRSYRYGADDSHHPLELLPNRRRAYREGIANVASFFHDELEMEIIFNHLKKDGLLVEITKPGVSITSSSNPDISPDVWLYDRILNETGYRGETPIPAIFRQYRLYKPRFVPPRFLLHNEFVIGASLARTVEYLHAPEAFFQSIQQVNAILEKDSRDRAAFAVFLELFIKELSGRKDFAELRQELELRNTTAEKDLTYLAPIAFVDYFSTYRAQDLPTFKKLFVDQLDEDLINLYWHYGKDEVRKAALFSATSELTDLEKIIKALRN